MATSTQINAITALYVGYFDRAPDPAGLQFWIDQIDNGREFNTIAADFAASAEAVALYPYLTTPAVSSPAAFITNIYANLFGRTPDDEGLEFWTGVLEDGSVSVADMIEAIIMGARDDAAAGTFDKSVLDNKVEVGLDFALETGNVAGFKFDAAAKAAAVAAVNGVTEDQATVDAAKAATDAFVADGTVPGTVGQTLTLTAAADNLVGTADVDTFQAVVGAGAADTLTVFDKLDGGAGEDTLDMIVTGDLITPGGVSIKNIETVNLFRDATLTPATAVNAATFVGAKQIWQIDNASAINNLVDGQAAGFRDTALNGMVTYKAGATAATVALDNIATNGQLDVVGKDLETVTVSGTVDNSVAAKITVNIGNPGSGADAVTDVVLALENDTDVTVIGNNALSTLETIDASGSTGGITASIFNSGNDGYAALSSVVGGSGNDDLTLDNLLSFEAETVEISGGAGNDLITITDTTGTGGTATAVAVNITGGAGNDTLAFTNTLANITDASEASFMDSLITFADFNGDEDVLDLNGSLAVLSNTDRANIAAEDNLFDALTMAAGKTTSGTTVAFDFGGDAYIYSDNGTDTTPDLVQAGDGLVKLAGFSVENFDSSNLI
ncbi:S-layer protein (plasmid) [Sulfitobacter indolifex]|nr:S-layer protein [Sulfitobacter indolifex]UOA20837.1 S-layer protein [Sulfitobacter indolifex]